MSDRVSAELETRAKRALRAGNVIVIGACCIAAIRLAAKSNSDAPVNSPQMNFVISESLALSKKIYDGAFHLYPELFR
jgi:hypothetical protein